MIVGEYFTGDTADPLARMQHDVYHDALQIIQRQAIRQVEFALTVLGTDDPRVVPKLGFKESDLVFAFDTHRTRVKGIGTLRVDHRTLQDPHDLLAAAWRFRVMPPRAPLFDLPSAVGEATTKWLRWLHYELDSWIAEPWMARLLQTILTNQNEPAGYTAENRLCLEILDRFRDVPWRPEREQAHSIALSKRLSAENLGAV